MDIYSGNTMRISVLDGILDMLDRKQGASIKIYT